MTERALVDTNVWVYAVDKDEPTKQSRAREVLAPTGESDLVVSAQVLGEFFVVVTRKLARAVREADAQQMVERMRQLPVVAIDDHLVAAAIAASRQWHLSYWDALIVVAAEASGCRRVLTEDLTGGATYGSVVVENPFAV
jgi:predicted nucleic acid-binding protein